MRMMYDGLADLMRNAPTEQSGVLTRADIDTVMDAMYANARPEPDMLYVSVTTYRRIRHWERIGRLYAAHPMPDYALRTCVRRRIVAARQAGMTRIRRVERREAREEQLERAVR
jgi:hypothetical protein